MKILQKLADTNKEQPELKAVQVKAGTASATDTEIRISTKTSLFDGFYREGFQVEDSVYTEPNSRFTNNPIRSFEFNLATFLKDLEFVTPSISNNEVRYSLCGVALHGKYMVTTNGHTLKRAYMGNVDFENTEYERGSIVPAKAIKFLIMILKECKKTVNSVHVTLCKRGISFVIGDYLLETLLIDRTYPEYHRVVPDLDGAQSFEYDQKEMKKVLKQLKAYNKAHNIIGPLMRLENKQAIRDDFVVDLDITNCPIPCGFNMKYLSDIPSGIAYIKDNIIPMRIESGRYTSVIMPVRNV